MLSSWSLKDYKLKINENLKRPKEENYKRKYLLKIKKKQAKK